MALTLKEVQDNISKPSKEYWAERALANEDKFFKLTEKGRKQVEAKAVVLNERKYTH